MRELADGVWQLDGFPPNHVNVYVVGDVLIDAGAALDRRRILRQVAGFTVLDTPGIREPYHCASPDPERNRASARRLAALEPALVCFGHGPPVRDPAAFTAAVAQLAG